MKRVNADIYYQRAAGMLTGVMAAFCRHYGKKSIFAVAGDPMIRFSRDRWIYEYGIKHVDRIVVQNVDQGSFVKGEFGRQGILIPNVYQPVLSRPSVLNKHVLWVSTIRQIKRPDLFLDLAQALPGCHFTMVGGAGIGEGHLYKTIRARAQQLENVDFMGFIPYADVGQFFDNAVLFVNTSKSEGFPNTFLQSWARGVPTVSFVDSGARMDCKPLGQVVKSLSEMTSAVEYLLDNDTERLLLGEQCKSYVESNHALDRILDLYEEIFQGLLQARDTV